jgi:putative hydrolase of the HAD superfamily
MRTPGALVLDFGGVISRTLFETHAQSEDALGLPAGTLRWRGPFDPQSDPLWEAMQRDEITERDYWLSRSREVGSMLGQDWQDMQTLVRRARGADVSAIIRPEALACIHAAKAMGCKLAILSNELDLFYGADLRERLPVLAQFDVIEDATYSGILKPDPRAYQRCQAQLDVPAHQVVFVDDQLRNIQGALKFGWQAIQLDVTAPGAAFAEALARLKQTDP